MPSSTEGPSSPSSISPSPVEGDSTEQPPSRSLRERLRSLFRRGSGSSIRENLHDALTVDIARGEEADFSPEERAMLRNVLGLRGMRVDDVMVPRADIIAVPGSVALGDLLDIFRSAEHSRLPVYGETLDEPLGIVHVKDVLTHMIQRAADGRRESGPQHDLGKVDLTLMLSSLKILRPALYVPPSMPAIDLLAKMQATRMHMALVIDEYGGTDGLVTIEDLIEIVVGDIEDEHDEDTASMIRDAGNGTFVADARVALEDVAKAIGVDLENSDAAVDVDTLGGLLVTLAGRVPVRGEILPGPENLEFEVLDADPRRLKRVRIARRPPVPARDRKEPRRRERGEALALPPQAEQVRSQADESHS